MKLTTLLRLPFVAVSLVALAACGGDAEVAVPEDPVAVTEVAVVDDEFEPEAIGVDAGATVTWTWEGQNPHNVVGDGFESETQTSGSFEHTFDEAGEYEYVCTIHAGMDGVVVVR